jgi:hypothetical protein
MWRFLNQSAEGTSHRETGTECQDYSFGSACAAPGENVLVLACADGAGSAPQSAVGARIACQVAVRRAAEFFAAGNRLNDIKEPLIRAWIDSVHSEIAAEAQRRGSLPRELACTFLFCVLGDAAGAFAQVGDGAIVARIGEVYQPIFWPQDGEYLNTTFFVTDDEYASQINVSISSNPINEVAMFTDGLQMLALDYSTRTAHKTFFAPMFESLRTAADPQDLVVPLKQFLDSPKVNERTDDDKTLVIAVRVACVDATV